MGKDSDSDSESNISVLNKGTEPYWNWDGFQFSLFCFQVLVLMQTNLSPFIVAVIFTFKYLFNWYW